MSSRSIHTKQEQETATKPPPLPSIAQRAAYGTLATILLRLVSFACTQWTFRHVDPATLGQATISLELMHATCIFVSREGFRLALTRSETLYWNVAWCTVPVSTLVAAVALLYHLIGSNTGEQPEDSNTSSDYRQAGILYCLAAALEGWAEPAILYALRQTNVALKASAEGLATVTKTVALVAFVHYFEQAPVTAFGAAQVMYSLVYAAVLLRAVGPQLVYPVWSQGLHGPTCYMTAVFTLQGFFKHLLTEGDRIILTTLAGSYDQGVYAMGSAYGGLAARILLQPLEENGRLLWTRLAAASTSKENQKDAGDNESLEITFTVLVKLVLYIGFIFACLAVNYTGLLLSLLGKRWTNNPQATQVLSAFCVYTAFLAANGMTEAFVYATASSGTELGRLGVAHTVVGVVFALVAYLAVASWGTVGLVFANCVAMTCRILYSFHFVVKYFAHRRKPQQAQGNTWAILRSLLRRMLPHPAVLLAFVTSFVVTRMSRSAFEAKEFIGSSRLWWRSAAQHVGVGAVAGIGVLSLAYMMEQEFRLSTRKIWKGKQD